LERLTIIFGIVIAYIIISTLVSMSALKKTKDTASFMTAKNKMGPWVIGILMMSEFVGTGSTLGTAQTAYEQGFGAACNLVTLGVGYLLYGFFMAPKFQALGEYTISGALARKYGHGVRVIVSMTMIYALTTVNVSMYTGGAAMIASLLTVSIGTATFIIGVVTILSVTLGGMRGVGQANLIHTTFKYLGLIVVAWIAWQSMQIRPELIVRVPETHFTMNGIKTSTVIAWMIANIGAVFSTQYVIQCVSSLPSPADAKKASIIASVTIVPIGFLAAYIGVSSRAIFPNINSVMALPVFFNTMDPWLAGIAVSGIIAATFVTILACTLGATALIMKDFIVPIFKIDEKKQIVWTRLIAILIALAPLPFALFVPGLLKTIFFARALRTTVAVIAIFMFYLPNIGSSKSATYGLLLSVAGTTIWFIMGNPFGIDNIYVATAIPAMVMLSDRLFFKTNSNKIMTADERN